MKKTLFLLAMLPVLVLSSCSKDDDEPGSIELTVSYFYNSFQGYKPDVGATAYLFEYSKKDLLNLGTMTCASGMMGVLIDKNEEYHFNEYTSKGTADVNGVIRLKNINPGSYFIMVGSEGRYLYSMKDIIIKSGEELTLVKNFGYKNEFSSLPETW